MAWIACSELADRVNQDLFGAQLHHGFLMNADPERFLRYLRPVLEQIHTADAKEGG